MASAGSPSSSVKSESDYGLLDNIRSEDALNLVSDDEGDAPATPMTIPPQLGPSVFSGTKPTVAAANTSIQQQMNNFRVRQAREAAAKAQTATNALTAAAAENDQIVDDTAQLMPTDPGAAFAELKNAYERKKRAETNTFREDIDFMRAENDEELRINMNRANQIRSPSPFFVPESATEIPAFLEVDDADSDQENTHKQGRKRRAPATNGQDKAPKKQRKSRAKKPANTEADADDSDVVARATTHLASKKAKKTTTAKPRAKKAQGPTMLNTSNLLGGSNVFEDAAQTINLNAQPTFGGTTIRKNAMQQLMDSIPADYQKSARQDKKFLDDAIKSITGRGSVSPAADGKWLVRGMKTSLESYQILGVSFLRKRENGQAPHGGILGDQMGLGKTLMMLANIVNGRTLHESRQHTTLIVASPALIKQWRGEVERHVHTGVGRQRPGIGGIFEYSGAMAKNASNDIINLITQHDIVFTTYSQVSKSYPKGEVPAQYTTAEQKQSWWNTYYEENKGVLHRVKFHRIVLDEAQAIKNHASLTSRACRAITAKHHWAISGTPVLNNIKEFYPYFRFLREPLASANYRQFKQNFCTAEDPEGIQRLQVFLRKFMIRRTHQDTLFDAKLLNLPQPHENTLYLELNEIERAIYEIVKKRFIQRINCISKSNELDKQYHHIWTMLLRLRQLCSHPALIQGAIVELLEQEDVEKLKHLTISEPEISEDNTAMLSHLSHCLQNKKTVETNPDNVIIEETETVPANITGAGDPAELGGKHGLKYRFSRYLTSLEDSEEYTRILDRSMCVWCRQPPDEPWVTSCFHIYCWQHLQDLQEHAARQGRDGARCTECGVAYDDFKPCDKTLARFSKDHANITDSPGNNTAGKPKKESVESWVNMNGEILPSAKTFGVKGQVWEWIHEDPDCKIIIYSQFIPMLHVLGRVCKEEGWEFCKYTGNMSHDSRERAIQEFGDPAQNKRIFLMSLKCGGLGLNLTMASRVITLDPWWNQAVEQQAFCRVFRIGQEKETKMTRTVVRGTIDEAILALQQHKQVDIDHAMDDAKRKKNLTTYDLMRLFGNVREDEGGKPFIWAEDAEDEEIEEVPRVRGPAGSDDEGMMGDED